MKIKHIVAAWILALATAIADTPVPIAQSPAPPKIPAEMRAAFWRSQAEVIGIAAKAKQAQDNAVKIQNDMAQFCGEKWQLALDQTGEPSCQRKAGAGIGTAPAASAPVK